MKPIRHLGMAPKSAAEWIESVQQSKFLALGIDSYNVGETVQLLEQKTANILGKPSALFFPKGMTAQFAMLKASEEIAKNSNVILHPLSHLCWDEQDAYDKLLNLRAILIGSNHAPFSRTELDRIKTKAATLMLELPLRRAGFRLLAWQELLAIADWCKENNVHCHMDGARLWESTGYYGKSEAQIAALFDTVYVSFYKGLEGMGGAILAGEDAFINDCRIWRSRLAGDQFIAFPQLLSALDGLVNKRPQIPSLIVRAESIANTLGEMAELEVSTPQTNGFYVYLDGEKSELNRRAGQLTQQTGLKLFPQVTTYPNTEQLMVEIQVGHEHELITNQEIKQYFYDLVNIN